MAHRHCSSATLKLVGDTEERLRFPEAQGLAYFGTHHFV